MPTRSGFFYRFEPEDEFDIAKLLPAFDPEEDVQQWGARRIRILSRGDTDDQRLATKLKECEAADFPCLSRACPQCCRAWRRWIVGEMLRVLPLSSEMRMMVLVLPSYQAPLGKLHSLNAASALSSFKRKLYEAKLDGLVMIGSLDISLIVDRCTPRPPMWQLEIQAITSRCSSEDIRRALAPHYKPTVTIYRPLVFKNVKDKASQFSYCLKSHYERKVYRENHDRRLPRSKLPLQDAELSEVITYVNGYRFNDMTVMMGIRREGYHLVVS